MNDLSRVYLYIDESGTPYLNDDRSNSFVLVGVSMSGYSIGTDCRGVKMSKAPTLRSIRADLYLDNSRKKLMQILRERKEFPKFPKLLHLRPSVIIGDNWSPPHTVPVQSWQRVLHVVNAIVAP